jgi:hypothetical protein
MNLNQIKQLLDPFDSTATECDGMTNLCHTILLQNNIDHQPMKGLLIYQEAVVSHVWIDLSCDHSVALCNRIDYRARMWLGNSEEIPHGIFNPSLFPDVNYQGNPFYLKPLHPVIFDVLASTKLEEKIKKNWFL